MSHTTPHDPGDRRPADESELRAMVERGRDELTATDRQELQRIWRRIDEEIHGHLASASEQVVDEAHQPKPPLADDRSASLGTGPVPIDRARSRRGWMQHVPIGMAATLALVVGVGIGSTMITSGDDEPAPAALATFDLEPLTGVEVAAASATLVSTGESQTVQLELGDLSAEDGFLEVWLLDPDTGALTSLGPARPDGRYVVPGGADLDELTALDVSAEPLDGDPGHSGVSLLRGEVRWIG